MKSVQIRSFSCLYIPVFGLNLDTIQAVDCKKIKIAKIVMWLWHHPLAMVPVSPDSFGKSWQRKSESYLNSLQYHFTTKSDKNTSILIFWPFSKNILILSVRNRESLTNFRTISANRDKKLTESVKSITMWDRIFYKVLQILQIRHKKVQIPLAACRRIAIVRTFSSSHSRK